MVEKVQMMETYLNERVSNWSMLTVSARSGSSGKTKTNVSQILTYSDNLRYFSKEY